MAVSISLAFHFLDFCCPWAWPRAYNSSSLKLDLNACKKVGMLSSLNELNEGGRERKKQHAVLVEDSDSGKTGENRESKVSTLTKQKKMDCRFNIRISRLQKPNRNPDFQ